MIQVRTLLPALSSARTATNHFETAPYHSAHSENVTHTFLHHFRSVPIHRWATANPTQVHTSQTQSQILIYRIV